jgi:hypothetical protein
MRPSMCLVSALVVAVCSSPTIAQEGAEVPCNVTAPNEVMPGSAEPQRGIHGNRLLAVGPFGLWPNGTVTFKPGGPGFLTRNGSLVMKFGWTLGNAGELKVSGHRLDGHAPPLRASIGRAIDPPNFKPSYLIFPTPGCWEVNAQIAGLEDSKLTFVTRVVKMGEGPSGRLDHLDN